MKKVLITGVLGQTGSYLAEILKSENWEVHGTVTNPGDLKNQFIPATLHPTDLCKPGSLTRVLNSVSPEVIINLAAISSVAESWKHPVETFSVNAVAVNEIFSYLMGLSSNQKNRVKVIQASSSEIFASSNGILVENSPYDARNPYGVSKLAAHLIGHSARTLGFKWDNAVLFNHESPRRPAHFLSKKVARAVAEIKLGLRTKIELGDLSPHRDWGWAPDVAKALYLLMNLGDSDDYIISTGYSHSVEEFVSSTFRHAGISDWRSHVLISRDFIRPKETLHTVGSPLKFMQKTGWAPSKTFEEITGELLEFELASLNQSSQFQQRNKA